MRNPVFCILLATLLVCSRTAYAACTAPVDEVQTPCISCGNLEQNVARAHDLAWNAFLRHVRMQLELQVFGATRVHLINPPHSSPGVLYYTVLIEDPDFRVTDSESHAEAIQLMRSWSAGFSYSGANTRAEWIWRQSITSRIESIVSRSVSTGSAPYVMRLMDSKGNAVEGGTTRQPRLTGEQQPALAGPSDLHPDDRFANEACVSEDPRHEGNSSSGTGASGGGDWSDNADNWEGWGNGYGDVGPQCRPDFSDPAGAGVICVI